MELLTWGFCGLLGGLTATVLLHLIRRPPPEPSAMGDIVAREFVGGPMDGKTVRLPEQVTTYVFHELGEGQIHRSLYELEGERLICRGTRMVQPPSQSDS